MDHKAHQAAAHLGETIFPPSMAPDLPFAELNIVDFSLLVLTGIVLSLLEILAKGRKSKWKLPCDWHGI